MNKLHYMIDMLREGRLQSYIDENPQNRLHLYRQALKSMNDISDDLKSEAEQVLNSLAMLDHIGYGTSAKYFNFPSRISEKEKTATGVADDGEFFEIYRDGLNEIVPYKILEVMKRIEELEKEKKLAEGVVIRAVQNKELNEFDRWFWTYWIELSYVEIDVLRKWLRYWLRIDRALNPRESYEKSPELSDSDIQRAKDHPLEDLYEGQLSQTGNKFKGLCPFHEERTPSFVIFTNTNRYKCFGGCGVAGDAIDFYMRKTKCTFREAVEVLA